jgi:hypothetical protein
MTFVVATPDPMDGDADDGTADQARFRALVG